jgi:hypothetical protein
MLTTQKWGLMGVLLAALVLAGTTRLLGAPVPGAKEDSAEVKKLLVQRRDHLREAVRAAEEEYKAGRVSLNSVFELRKLLFEADLDLARTPAERRAVYLELFKATVEIDELLTSGFEAGRVKASDYHTARAARLKAEIDLRRAGGTPPGDIKPPRESRDPRKGDK